MVVRLVRRKRVSVREGGRQAVRIVVLERRGRGYLDFGEAYKGIVWEWSAGRGCVGVGRRLEEIGWRSVERLVGGSRGRILGQNEVEE